MNRTIAVLNFLGVVALAVLCGAQWAKNHQATQQHQDLQAKLEKQSSRVEAQNAAIGGLSHDLDALRTELDTMSNRAARLDSENQALGQTLALTQAEDTALKESITNWTQAIKTRDARLLEFNRRLEEIASERNTAIAKYNELASRISRQ